MFLLATGCAGSPAPFVAGWWSALPTEPTIGPEFASRVPAAVTGLHGAIEQPIWLPDDEMTFALELLDGASVEEQWLVRLRVIGPEDGTVVDTAAGIRVQAMHHRLVGTAEIRRSDGKVEHSNFVLGSHRHRVHALVTEIDGAEIYADESVAWDGLHQVGLFQFLGLDAKTTSERSTPLAGDGSVENPFCRKTTDPMMLSMLMVRLLQTFQANRALADVLWQVADTPALGDALGTLLSPTVDWDELRGVMKTSPPPMLRSLVDTAFSLPFRISMGSSTVLLANFIIVPPTGVFALTAGIVGMCGHRPSDPGKRFVLTLVGARRGGASRVAKN